MPVIQNRRGMNCNDVKSVICVINPHKFSFEKLQQIISISLLFNSSLNCYQDSNLNRELSQTFCCQIAKFFEINNPPTCKLVQGRKLIFFFSSVEAMAYVRNKRQIIATAIIDAVAEPRDSLHFCFSNILYARIQLVISRFQF